MPFSKATISSNMNNYENEVVVSYAWGGESENTVDKLESAFAARGIHIVRDKKDLDYKNSIESFEQRIGQGQCIVLVISDKYLRSEHCMHELVEVDKNHNLRDRVFPIVLADAQIYKAVNRLNYIQYWDKEIDQLNQAIKDINVMSNLSRITTTLDKYTSIRASFDELSDLLSDMNAQTPEILAANDFSTLINAVEHEMRKTKQKQVELIKFNKFKPESQQDDENEPEQLHKFPNLPPHTTIKSPNTSNDKTYRLTNQRKKTVPTFETLRNWLDKLVDTEFRDMINSLLTVQEINHLSRPLELVDRGSFLGQMRIYRRLDDVEKYLLKNYSERFYEGG